MTTRSEMGRLYVDPSMEIAIVEVAFFGSTDFIHRRIFRRRHATWRSKRSQTWDCSLEGSILRSKALNAIMQAQTSVIFWRSAPPKPCYDRSATAVLYENLFACLRHSDDAPTDPVGAGSRIAEHRDDISALNTGRPISRQRSLSKAADHFLPESGTRSLGSGYRFGHGAILEGEGVTIEMDQPFPAGPVGQGNLDRFVDAPGA